MAINSSWFKYGSDIPGLNFNKQYPEKYCSDYASNTHEPGISPAIFNAVNAYQSCMSTLDDYALGKTANNIYLAEIHKANVNICIAVSSRGVVYGCLQQKDTGTIQEVQIDRDIEFWPILLAIMPLALNEQELKILYGEFVEKIVRLHSNGIKDLATEFGKSDMEIGGNLAKFCDNIYSRIMFPGSYNDIKLSINSSGELRRFNSNSLAAGNFMPVTVFGGTFEYFTHNTSSTTTLPSSTLDDLPQKYSLGRTFNAADASRIPYYDSMLWEMPPYAEKICNLIKNSHGPESLRNFMFQGPSGSGKTDTTGIIAYGLQLPKVTFTCNAGTEISDFIGQVLPTTSSEMSLSELMKKNNLPTIDDITFDLEGSYKRLTGIDTIPIGFDSSECIMLLMQSMKNILAEDAQKQKDYIYSETDFLRAMKSGWLIEIQEPTLITQPGVLPGLNNILGSSGHITLPTGNSIVRHPDTIVIITTNLDYHGCYDINQSVESRMDMVFTIETPDKQECMDRAIKRSGFANIALASIMTDIFLQISDWRLNHDVLDGCCGIRELTAWMKAVKLEGESSCLENAKHCIIFKATKDIDEQAELITSFLSSSALAI